MSPQEAADALVGTCNTGVEIEDFTLEECREFDDLAFCCVACGWWFSQAETPANDSDSGWVCDDCVDSA